MEPTQSSSISKSYGGLIVVLVATLGAGVWLYGEYLKSGLEAKIDTLASRMQVQAPAPAPAKPDATTAFTPPAGWFEAVSVKHGYRLWLPPTARFSESDDTAYVVSPTEDNPTPIPEMAISVRDVSEQIIQSDTSRVIRGEGSKVYYLNLWEGLVWQPFEQVVASFRTH